MPWVGNPATAVAGSIYTAAFYNVETRDRMVYLKAAVDALEAGGMILKVVPINMTIAFELEGDYDFTIPAPGPLTDYLKAAFIGQFFSAGSSSSTSNGFGNIPYYARLTSNTNIRVTTTANAGAPSTGRLVGTILEFQTP